MESSSFECITCKLNITGFTNFQRHVNSIEHANHVRMKISNNVTDEEKVFTSAECEEPTSTLNQYSPPSFSSMGLACDLCQKRFSGNEPYQQHLASAGHKKKVASLTNPNSSVGQLRCDICDKDFSGKVPYEQHIVSKVHLKKALFNDKEQKSFPAFLAEHQIGGNSSYDSHPMEIDSGNSKLNGSSLKDSIPKPVATEVTIPASVVASQLLLSCDICDKRFSGPVSYQQHMVSQIHKKKEQEKEMLKIFYSSSNSCEVDSANNHDKMDGINNSGIGSSCLENDFIKSLSATSQVHPFRCADCDKNFTGLVPYDQHMKSAMHLKKMLQKKQMNEETDLERKFPVTTPKSEIPNSERYFCKICDKQCTGNIPFTQHNLSEAHRKKLQVLSFNQELNDLSKPNDSNIDDDQMSTDDNYAIELSKKSSSFSNSSELSFNDILKEVNHVSPDTLNVVMFGVGDSIVF